MTDAITVTYTPDAALIRAASLSWRQKTPFIYSILGGMAFGLAAILIIRLGLRFDPQTSHFVAFGIGAAMMLAFWQLNYMRDLRRITDAALDGDPETTLTFSAADIHLVTAQSDGRIRWPAVTAITAIKGGTGLRIGASVVGIPDEAISTQMTPKVFRDRLSKWREAADA